MTQDSTDTASFLQDADHVLEQLEVEPERGLTVEQARERLDAHGPNTLVEAESTSVARILLEQMTDVMVIVLIVAAGVSMALGEVGDAVAILVIVVLNAIVGTVQAHRAEQAIAALRAMAAPAARVRRAGLEQQIESEALVPGDIVLLEAGNTIPADLRLFDVYRLKMEEAVLTGESLAVDKLTRALDDPRSPLGDRVNMAFKGTHVAAGRAEGVVVQTGMDTELGKIASLLRDAESTRTPLQHRLDRFGKMLALVVLAICALLFGVGVLRGEPVVLMFLTSVSLAVAAIPEGLPAVVTVALALGARKMVAKNALARRLPAVETLGSVTYICSDKTGTLTENSMRVEQLVLPGDAMTPLAADDAVARVKEPAIFALFEAMVLDNDARLEGPAQERVGDPTELALLDVAERAGVTREELEAREPRMMELPFDSTRKAMTTFHEVGTGYVAFTKGAPEMLLDRCAGCDVEAAHAAADALAKDGLRVLAVARRAWERLPDGADASEVERDLELLGLVGMMDPPRAEAKASVALCREAGIHPVMITGDHPATAHAIAVRIGLASADDRVMTGRELSGLTEEALIEQVQNIPVFARVDPEQKIQIVEALQARGEYVAMTGDGVNDAPSLKQSDIGVAMGKGGTDVAREAADVVLLDDNFASIVGAVEEGRRIFDNIRKFIRYTMTSNAGEIWTLLGAMLLGLPVPLLPIHILWINLVTDGLPGLALAVEPAEKGVMQRPPRPPGESIFAHGMWQHMLFVGLLMGGVCVATQVMGVVWSWEHWQSMVFTVLTLSQMGHVLAVRSETASLFSMGLFSNRPLVFAVMLTFALQMCTLYVPFLQPIFKTEALSLGELGLCLALSSTVFIAVEIEKAVRRVRLKPQS